jgi:hypothetical protein
MSGAAVDFNGTSGYVNCDGALSDPSILTIGILHKAGAGTGSEIYFGHRSASQVLIQVGQQSRTQIIFQLRSSVGALVTLNYTVGLDTNANDYFIVAVLNRTTNIHKLYINGVQVDTDTTVFTGNFTATKRTFGATNNGGYFTYTNGTLDDCFLFNGVELSPVQIAALNTRITSNPDERLNAQLRFELESVREGVASNTFDFTVPRDGYGFHYGYFYGGGT